MAQEVIPELSVVIPTFNRAAAVRYAIESAIEAPWTEVIVVDDGSNDNTERVLSTFGNRIVTVHQANQGVAVARNNGLRNVRAPFVKFLDSDDTLVPGALERQLTQVSQLPKQGVPVGALLAASDASLVEQKCDQNEQLCRIDTWHMATQTIQVSQPLLRVDSVRAVGGFRHSSMAEDYDLFLRLYMAGTVFFDGSSPVTYFNDALGRDRLSASALGGRFENGFRMYQKLALEAVQWRSSEAPVLRHGLGQQLWSLGRRMAREDFENEARMCFELAYDLAGRKAYKANIPLRFLYSFMDPLHLEKGLERLKGSK